MCALKKHKKGQDSKLRRAFCSWILPLSQHKLLINKGNMSRAFVEIGMQFPYDLWSLTSILEIYFILMSHKPVKI